MFGEVAFTVITNSSFRRHTDLVFLAQVLSAGVAVLGGRRLSLGRRRGEVVDGSVVDVAHQLRARSQSTNGLR